MASTPSTLAAWPCAGGSPALCHAHPRWLHIYHVALYCCPAAVQGLERTRGCVCTLPGACPAQGASRVSQDALYGWAAEQCPAGIRHFRPCFQKLWARVSKDRRGQQSSALCRCTMGAVVVAPPCPLAWHLGCLGLHFWEPYSMLGVLPLAQSSTSSR